MKFVKEWGRVGPQVAVELVSSPEVRRWVVGASRSFAVLRIRAADLP
jgi:hypothetical protein